MSSDGTDFLVLHAARVTGLVTDDALARVTGPPADVATVEQRDE
jgi:hypothetical protein